MNLFSRCLTLFLVFVVVLTSGIIVARAPASAAQAPPPKPFILPFKEKPGPDTWLLGQTYGNTTGAYRLSRMSGPRLLTLGLALDVNTATAEELEALPGIGPALAQRIVEYRKAHCPLRKLEDLLEVSGIGPKKLAELKPFISVQSAGQQPPEQR